VKSSIIFFLESHCITIIITVSWYGGIQHDDFKATEASNQIRN
jgi:hypothetical protein